MNWLDIVIIIILIIAAVSGYRKGMISQAFGIAGLLLGIYLGYRFSSLLSGWFGLSGGYANLLSFIVILVSVIVIAWLFGLFAKKVFRMTGFGLLDDLGGLVLGVIKIGLILALLLNLFIRFNREAELVKPEVFTRSIMCRPLQRLADAVFPWALGSEKRRNDGGKKGVYQYTELRSDESTCAIVRPECQRMRT